MRENGIEHPSEAVVAGSRQVLRSIQAQWKRLELDQGLLYRCWDDIHTGTITRQLLVPRPLVPEFLHAQHNGMELVGSPWTLEDNK